MSGVQEKVLEAGASSEPGAEEAVRVAVRGPPPRVLSGVREPLQPAQRETQALLSGRSAASVCGVSDLEETQKSPVLPRR